MEIFVLFLIILLTGLNLLVSISTSMVLIKIYDILQNQEERYQTEEHTKRQARSLIDVNTPQFPYNLRVR